MADPPEPPQPPEPLVPPEREPAEPAESPEPATLPTADGPDPAEGGEPAETGQTYTLPTARKVVASGLQLALASTSDLRRASIYIGLLVLGSFGPAAIAVLLILGRLGDQAADAFGSVFIGPSYGAPPQPALEAALLVIVIEVLVGLLLFLSISIDAQSMGIAILGGRASERPLRLWEAIIRARQAFWRMAGAGAVVGVVSVLVQGFLATALGGFSRSVDAASITAGIIATIVVAPLAYVSTGIVLGDVSATESLARSWRLFQARRLLAVVVVLFTFVTSAIQLFALSSGLDLIVRASELLHVSLTEGFLAFAIAIVLILAAVVAYGSLTFTIGAIVSAPQVAGFLGLTFYSGGLDKARIDGQKPPRGFRYVSRPMAVAMIALAAVVGLEIPAINSIPTPPPSVMLELVREKAAAESDLIEVSGYPTAIDDRPGDVTGNPAPEADLLRAEVSYLPFVPDWLLEGFDCDLPSVACGDPDHAWGEFEAGYLIVEQAAAPLPADDRHAVALLLALQGEVAAFRRDEAEPYGGASRVFITRPGADATLKAQRSQGDAFTAWRTGARSTWSGDALYLLLPESDVPEGPIGWDVVLLVDDEAGAITSRDTFRSTWTSPLRQWEGYPSIFIDDYRLQPHGP